MNTKRRADGLAPDFADEVRNLDAEPLRTSSARYMATHGTPLVDTAKRRRPPSGQPASQGGTDAAFLVKGFHIPPGRAAALVAGANAAVAEGEARRLLSEDDPLAGVPTPREPATDLATDTDEERLKPVLHRPRTI